jgi:SH3-like domain-containing protein
MRYLLSLLMPALLLASPAKTLISPATVNRPVQNMHSAPSDDSDVVSQAIYGTTVSVLEVKDTWARVQTPDEYTGWMPLTSTRRVRNGDRFYASNGRLAQVKSLFSNLYREPDVTKHQPLLVLPFETRLEVIVDPVPSEGRWLQVRLVDDQTAYIQRGDVWLVPPTMSVSEMIALSKHFLGAPYLWGGVSPFGFDCSGFTQMLCRRRGILLPRDASQQAGSEKVTAVEKTDLQPGDLLFFGKSADKITHTGLYIGDGQFIHATTHIQPVVQVSKLADEYWTKLLVATRRPK